MRNLKVKKIQKKIKKINCCIIISRKAERYLAEKTLRFIMINIGYFISFIATVIKPTIILIREASQLPSLSLYVSCSLWTILRIRIILYKTPEK